MLDSFFPKYQILEYATDPDMLLLATLQYSYFLGINCFHDLTKWAKYHNTLPAEMFEGTEFWLYTIHTGTFYAQIVQILSWWGDES